jgi:acyl dehydratase
MNTHPTFSRIVTRGDNRHFAAAVNATDRIYHDVEFARSRGYRDLVAPPFFFCVVGLSLGVAVPSHQLRPDGIPAIGQLTGRVMAGESAVSWFAPIVAGDEVIVSQDLASREPKIGRNGPLTLHTYVRRYEVSGQLAVLERFVRIERP